MRIDDDGQVDVAVGTGERVDGHRGLDLRAEPSEWVPHRRQGRVPVRLEHHDVQQGDVDVLALAGLLPVPQGSQRADGGVQAGEVVADPRRRLHGAAIRIAVERHPTGERLRSRVVAGTLTQRPVLTPSGDRHEHDVSLHRPAVLVADAPGIERAGAEVLHDHVGGGDEVEEEPPSRCDVHVDRHGALVAVGRLVDVTEARARQIGWEQAGDLARRGLHLDDVSAEVGQHAARHRTRPARREVDHPDAGQRPDAGGQRLGKEHRLVHAGIVP